MKESELKQTGSKGVKKRAPEVLRPEWAGTPGVIAGFCTRRGGASTGRFAELNFSWKWPDPGCGADENHSLLASQEGYDRDELYLVRQVHGRSGVCCDEMSPGETLATEGDYLVASRPGTVCGVITADCVPVLVWEPERRCVAAVHSGWRGTLAGVVEAAIDELCSRYCAERRFMLAAVGPAIGACCFEVGEDVAVRFESAFSGVEELVHRRPGVKPHVDLLAAVSHQLDRAGVEPGRVDTVRSCTYCNPSRFYSYRRDGSPLGQHMSFVGIPERP